MIFTKLPPSSTSQRLQAGSLSRFPQQTGRKNQDSLILGNYASLLGMGMAVRYLPLFKPWAVRWYCWRRASGLLHEGVLVFKKMWFWRKQSKAWIFFFFFLFGNSISFISILNFFFYLRYHFPSTAVYTSLLCAPFVKYNLRLLLYALIPPMSQSLVPLGTLRRPALSILLNLSTSSPVPEK